MTIINIRSPLAPASLRGWVITGPTRAPRFWATVWIDTLKHHLADSSRRKLLASVDSFYTTAADATCEDLDNILGRLDIDGAKVALEAHLLRLRNMSVQRNHDYSAEWNAVLGFVRDVITGVGAVRDHSTWHEVEAHLLQLDHLYRQLRPSRPRPPEPIRALPAIVVEDLYNIFEPASRSNPFKSAPNKYRNLLVFLLLLHLGVRRGEALLLKLDSIRSEFDPRTNRELFWAHITTFFGEDDDLPDPRYDPPRLKTLHSRRVLPISVEIAAAAEVYIGGYRHRSTSAALLTSQKLRPLSVRSFNEIFETATGALSGVSLAALKRLGKSTVQPHDLRHTAAVRRLAGYRANGIPHSEAVEKLRVFFGWSDTSSMPRYYARAYYETEYDDVWQDRYDSYVETIRSLGDEL